MNDRDITRYEINEHGEIPLSYGRYVRYEDYDNHVQWLLGRIEKLEDELASAENPCCDYDAGYQYGYIDGTQDGIKKGMLQAAEVIMKDAK